MAQKGKSKSPKRKSKKKTNLSRLCLEMNKLTRDAVDKEVTKRFKILIETTEEDITKVSLNQILKDPKDVDLSIFHESLQPYIKHYLFMAKRNKK
jgi:hypothetical protein